MHRRRRTKSGVCSLLTASWQLCDGALSSSSHSQKHSLFPLQAPPHNVTHVCFRAVVRLVGSQQRGFSCVSSAKQEHKQQWKALTARAPSAAARSRACALLGHGPPCWPPAAPAAAFPRRPLPPAPRTAACEEGKGKADTCRKGVPEDQLAWWCHPPAATAAAAPSRPLPPAARTAACGEGRCTAETCTKFQPCTGKKSLHCDIARQEQRQPVFRDPPAASSSYSCLRAAEHALGTTVHPWRAASRQLRASRAHSVLAGRGFMQL